MSQEGASQRRYGGAKMDYLGALRMFVRAVEVGSFSKAAIATNTKTSTVSRAIRQRKRDTIAATSRKQLLVQTCIIHLLSKQDQEAEMDQPDILGGIFSPG